MLRHSKYSQNWGVKVSQNWGVKVGNPFVNAQGIGTQLTQVGGTINQQLNQAGGHITSQLQQTGGFLQQTGDFIQQRGSVIGDQLNQAVAPLSQTLTPLNEAVSSFGQAIQPRTLSPLDSLAEAVSGSGQAIQPSTSTSSAQFAPSFQFRSNTTDSWAPERTNFNDSMQRDKGLFDFLNAGFGDSNAEGYRAVPQEESGTPLSPIYAQNGTSREPSKRPAEFDPNFQAGSHSVGFEDWSAHIAAAKALGMLQRRYERVHDLDKDSVFGAAIIFPQLARSSGWSMHYTGFMARSIVFLILCLLLQGFLVYMIAKEERVNDKFGGQMHLCDLGAHLTSCPGSPNCLGPGGTEYTPKRLFNWQMWASRVYVLEALMAAFPDQANEIEQRLDPGEYGMESYWLRLACCFIFVLGLWQDLTGSINLAKILIGIPTSYVSWMVYNPAEDREEMSGVTMKIDGMPLHWKLFNLFFVLVPKLYMWVLTVDVGILFLMETAGIEDLVVNAVALAFILSLDEIFYTVMFTDVAKALLDAVEPYEWDQEGSHRQLASDLWEQHQRNRAWHFFTPGLLRVTIPGRLIAMVLVTLFFLAKYYREHCFQTEDGSWVPHPLEMPTSYHLPFLSFLFGPVPVLFPIPTEDTFAWVMPSNASA